MTRLFRVMLDGAPTHVLEDDGEWRRVRGDLCGGWTRGDVIAPATGVPLAPLRPGKIVGIGRNYRDHAAERGKPVPTEPLVFLKPPSAVVGPGEPIVLPLGVGRVDHEAELGIVIGRRARAVPRRDALAHVMGITCVNDVTARDLQNRGVQFSHAKGFDTFCPLGPCVALGWPGAPELALGVEGLVDGVVRQRGNTRDLIFPVDELIAYVSAIMTLEPGDVLATGTPAGIGPLQPGNTVTVRVEGVGELTNPVAAAGETGPVAATAGRTEEAPGR